VPRFALALFAALIALASPLAGAAVDFPGVGLPGAGSPGTIGLRARQGQAFWKTSLSLRLVKTRLIAFELCAIWNRPPTSKWGRGCNAAPSNKLPEGTALRLEQSPVRRAIARADSPGWGLLGMSEHAAAEAVLSNPVGGNRLGRLRYRATLRNRAGEILATSNTVELVWHR